MLCDFSVVQVLAGVKAFWWYHTSTVPVSFWSPTTLLNALSAVAEAQIIITPSYHGQSYGNLGK